MTRRAALAGRVLALLVLGGAAIARADVHRYEVTVDPALERVSVRACFEGEAPRSLAAESDGARFYLESMHIGKRVLEPDGDQVALGEAGPDACVDYVVKLQPAQGPAQSGGPETRRVGGSMLTAIGDWLWRAPDAQEPLELRFRLPPRVGVSVPWRRAQDASGQPVFLVGPTPASWPGIAAFGRFDVHDVEVAGAVLHVALVSLETPA
ncbi:MAG TPA: hypothetical protein VFV71_12945, partial [Burkholderiales bacterium]|nr:hypothetical protein [Burkholderiales bacterium]